MKAKKTEIYVLDAPENRPVRIVSDAAISTQGRHGGRLLPLLLIDTTARPDIAELIRAHGSFGTGDVKSQWGKVEAKGHEGTVALFLTFVRPLEFFMVLEFDIVKQGFLVEQTLVGNGIYLARAEGEEDRLSKNPERPKVLVEVPDTGFRNTWDDMFYKSLARRYRGEGLNRSESRQAARSAIKEWRKLGSFQMRDTYK